MARFGARVGVALTERNAALPHDVSERLRFAREHALARAAQARAAATAAATAVISPAAVQLGATLALGGSGGNGGSMTGPAGPNPGGAGLWSMLMSALPLLLLAAGLLLMAMGQENEQIAAAAEVDTALLSDSLPPAAFTDPGFSEFLRDAEE
ncbi:DUF3619 family protein [Roseateles sp. DC23W]|uniref:DUF3619 family protein n=1 Tax=Pelomonas dachongensis TaxID=3299029 RepID=A0ABW7EMZ9_9BURK